MAESFQRDKSTISRHIKNIFSKGELSRDSVVVNFATTAAGIKQIRNLLKMLAKDYGITITIPSHLLVEVENLADTAGLINHGKMIKEISMKEIMENNLAYIELETAGKKQKKSRWTKPFNENIWVTAIGCGVCQTPKKYI